MNYKNLLKICYLGSFSLVILFASSLQGKSAKQEKSKEEASCSIISKGLDKGLDKQPEIKKVIDSLMQSLKAQDSELLNSLMHPRLKMDKAKIKVRIFEQFGTSIYYPVSNYSLYRVWHINNPAEEVKPVLCSEDELSIVPHFGYKQQYSVWIQVMGAKEIGRIYTTIVPVNGKWYLGSFETKQWTQDSKNWETWATLATDDYKKDRKIQSYLEMDIATNLISGFSYITLTKQPALVSLQKEMFSTDLLGTKIKELFPKLDIVATTGLFSVGGIGVLVRYRVKPTDEAVHLSEDCKKMAAIILKDKNFDSIVGVRCSFILDKEKIDKDGVKGSIYYDKSTAFKANKKK